MRQHSIICDHKSLIIDNPLLAGAYEVWGTHKLLVSVIYHITNFMTYLGVDRRMMFQPRVTVPFSGDVENNPQLSLDLS